MYNNLKALLFDFDGTLLDSFSIHYDVYKLMFEHFDIQINRERFLRSYSPDWYQTYEAMGLPDEDWESANEIWVEEAEKRDSNLFPGIKETLSLLSGSHVIGLVTSGTKSRVMKDLERTGINHLFKTIVTGDDIKIPKPSPEGLELAIQNLGLRPNDVAYIGDADADYKMARAAGIHFIGVISDFSFLNPIDPKYCIKSVTELPGLIGLFE